MNAETLMQIAGVAQFALTLYWVRSRELRERYAIGWIIIACLLLVCGLFPSLIMGFANQMRLSYSSAVLFIALAFVYVFAFLVTVSLTRQYRRNVRLMQEVAILENRLREMERSLAGGFSHSPLAGKFRDDEAPRG